MTPPDHFFPDLLPLGWIVFVPLVVRASTVQGGTPSFAPAPHCSALDGREVVGVGPIVVDDACVGSVLSLRHGGQVMATESPAFWLGELRGLCP